MRVKGTLKSIFQVALSNCTTIISGIIVGFLVPKILSVEGYGFYKTFTLYTTYVGFFNLGMIDGIVLDYGEKNYSQLDRLLFRCYHKWYLAIHIFFGIVIFIAGIFVKNSNYKYIFVMLGINMIAVNFTGYYQQISQITQRFKEYSIRKILQSISNVIIVALMFSLYLKKIDIDYKAYVAAIVAINIVLTLWYLYTYKDISFGKSVKMAEIKDNVIHLIKIGFPLLFANLCSTLILTLDRQFVNILFDTSTYAVYAFAYSMLTLVTVATSAISTVLYPTLKRTNEETMKDNFSALVGIVLILVYAAIAIYFPLNIFVTWFLPQYMDSLIIFRVIAPGIAMSSAITVVMHNYYKVLEENFTYFKKSIVVLLTSFIANMIAYLLFRTTVSISIASIVTMIFWYLYIERFFVKQYGYNGVKNFGYLMVMLCGFYLISAINNQIIGLLTYIMLFILFTFSFYQKILKKFVALINKSRKEV